MKTYKIAEVFYSLQGEGGRVGHPSLFVRFAGCNQKCGLQTHGFDCDTDFTGRLTLTAEQLESVLKGLSSECSWVVFTGGEPGLQLDSALVDRLHGEGYLLAVETNGTLPLPPNLDYISVSPKTPEADLHVGTAHELRYVLGAGQPLPEPSCSAPLWYISPAFRGNNLDPEALAWCVQLVKDNPRWKLSVQAHKLWSIP